MNHAGFIIVSYLLTLGGIAGYVVRMLARGKRLARQVPAEDRPWT